MLWKLAFTLTVVLLIAGRTSALRNPLLRLLLPRKWVAVLSALPTRRGPEPGSPERPTRPRPSPSPSPSTTSSPSSSRGHWLDRRTRIVLIVLALAGLAALLATRAMIWEEANAPIESPVSTPGGTSPPG